MTPREALAKWSRRWHFLDYAPNSWSLEHVHAYEGRFGAYVTCRQCGKTTTAANEIDIQLNAERDELFGPPHVGILGPTYDKAELSVMKYINMVREKFGPEFVRVNLSKHQGFIDLNGARFTWMSADIPESVQGHTFSALIVDEAQNVPDAVWEIIYPTLSARQGIVRAFGTPDITPDQTWFKALFWLGQDEDEPDYHSFTLSAYDNPWIKDDEIVRAKRNLPERQFRMLYLGEWVDVGGSVFQSVDRMLLQGDPPEPQRNTRYLMACDFAIHEDYNVVLIAERSTRTIVHLERWNRTDPIRTYDRIVNLWDKWQQPAVVADATGMGEAFIAELRERGMRQIRSVKFNATNKLEMVGRLQGAIEHRRIMSYEFKPLVNELTAYVYKQTPSGKLTTEAAAGFHDDCVAALLLLNEGLRGSYGNSGQYSYIGGESGGSGIHDKIRRDARRWMDRLNGR